MAMTTNTTYPADIQQLFGGGGDSSYQSPEWEPIRYTSMKGWLFMNYTLLAGLISLPVLILWGLL